MVTEEITMDEFLAKNRIGIKARPNVGNPHMPDTDLSMDHFHVRLVRPSGEVMELYWSKGFGLREDGNPITPGVSEIKDILDCLASDVTSVENADGSFEYWADELGYDTDSRKAEATFKVCEKQAAELKSLLGPEAFELLLWHTERL